MNVISELSCLSGAMPVALHRHGFEIAEGLN